MLVMFQATTEASCSEDGSSAFNLSHLWAFEEPLHQPRRKGRRKPWTFEAIYTCLYQQITTFYQKTIPPSRDTSPSPRLRSAHIPALFIERVRVLEAGYRNHRMMRVSAGGAGAGFNMGRPAMTREPPARPIGAHVKAGRESRGCLRWPDYPCRMEPQTRPPSFSITKV